MLWRVDFCNCVARINYALKSPLSELQTWDLRMNITESSLCFC